MREKVMKRLLGITTAILLGGCVSQPEVRPVSLDDQLQPPRPSYVNGSIWQTSSGGLTEDFKARRKGDIVTVVITEQASASKEASTGTKRDSSIHAGIPNLLGLEGKITGISNWMDLNNLINASNSSAFDGSGSTMRRENLTATISTRVIEVLPSGNFLIQGRRNVRVNNEDQIIVLDGVVRPRDISSDNTVNSSYVADARITYGGKGIISDRQQPGWLMGILDKIWPF